MELLYFTFGSDPAYPCGRDDYVLAVGKDRQDCVRVYNEKHPPREPGSTIINCADFYSPADWEKQAKKHYKGMAPKEVLVSDGAYGRKPGGFAPIWFWVPAKGQLVYLQEGSGDNLLPEDEAEGYKDYLDYTCFDLDQGDITESCGGQMMLTEYVQERYGCLADAIPEILDFEYEDMSLDAQILQQQES